MFLAVISLIIIASGGVISLSLQPERKYLALLLTAIPAALFIIFVCAAPLFTGQTIESVINMGFPFGDVRFKIDSISAFFIVLTALIYPLAVLFASDYLKEYNSGSFPLTSHWFLFPFFIISMIMVFAIQNIMAFLFVWEMMSLLSMLLLFFEHTRKDVTDATVNYLTTMHVGVVFLISGFMFIFHITGSYDFAVISGSIVNSKYSTLIFLVLSAGFAIKAGWFPFHSWLPVAHPAAPSHVSGLMSGLMIKTGIYGIIRTIEFTGTGEMSHALIICSITVITIFYSVLNGMTCSNIKKTLAFSSIENSAIIGLGVGVAMVGISSGSTLGAYLGFSGALIHLATHAVNKSALFFSSGIIHMKYNSLEMEDSGGLSKKMPLFSKLFLFFSLSISGMPFFSGFIGKFLIFISLVIVASKVEFGMSVVMIAISAALAFSSSVGAILYMKINSFIFFGNLPEKELHSEHETNKAMISLIVLAAVSFVCGVFPWFLFKFVQFPAFSFLNSVMIIPKINFLFPLSLLSVVFATLFLVILFFRKRFSNNFKDRSASTWGCGYRKNIPRAKYTPWSFSDPFSTLFKKITVSIENCDMPAVLFPQKGSFATSSDDAVNKNGIMPLINSMKKFLNLFIWIQSADGRKYILYIIVFLFITLFWNMRV
ncbi:MAG TPA: proton-conducting transporter membrane subunit [bacterium]|nr:proton-conducting transporter membrane subunit [bacterium]HQN72516.1 proton-conducting transporter membrane subunit [bacterium]